MIESDDQEQKQNDARRKRKIRTSLYYYSDLSVRIIAQQVDLPILEVKAMINSLTKSDSMRLLSEQAKASVDKIMSVDVLNSNKFSLVAFTYRKTWPYYLLYGPFQGIREIVKIL